MILSYEGSTGEPSVLTSFGVFSFYLQGHEPFVSYEGLEQLHRFLFILGITHVLYSFVTVVLSMIKVGVPSSLLI